ncbi:unnamed protein product [Ixodes hexagonus]
MGPPHSTTLLGSFLLLSVALLDSCAAADEKAATSFISATFSTTARMFRMAVDKSTGRVYVGGANSIHQLAANLTIESRADLGPYKDSSDCEPSNPSNVCPPAVNGSLEYQTKAMAIDHSSSSLIICGNRFQGACTLHNLYDISDFRRPSTESVVSSKANSSTVLFISNGPGAHKQVLYVGTSWTNEGPYEVDTPAVASRSLDSNNNTFSIAVRGETSGTRMFVNSLSRPMFPITYVFGFNFRGFSYWLTVQRRSLDEEAPFISKLVRVCQNDPHYYSYTEVELVCSSSEGVHYNLAHAGFVSRPGSDLATSLGSDDDALFVVFAKSENKTNSLPGSTSALCVFPLEVVMWNFTDNIRDCYEGVGRRGLDFITPSTPCLRTHVAITDFFCGLEVNTPLEGAKPITTRPVLAYADTLLTSVAAVPVYNHTVAFLGTRKGHLKKVLVESAASGFEVDDIVVDEGKPVNKDMPFDRNADHIYVMTQTRVSAVEVQQCSRFKTCNACASNRDPYCGWCGMTKTCSLRANCRTAADDPSYWLPYKTQCSPITSISPSQIPKATIRQLNVTISNETRLEDENLVCVFTRSGMEAQTKATRTGDGATCATPNPDTLSPNPSEDPDFTVKLSLGRNMTPEYFTFYDCNAYKTCTECTSSAYPCTWCTLGHRCTHDRAENCRNDILITNPVKGLRVRAGPGFCPRIRKSSSSSNEIVVPKGATLGIRVQVENIGAFMVQSRFVCQFLIEGRVKQVNGQLLADSVYCGRIPFKYDSEAPNATALFGVQWETKKFLDNPENIHVVVYDCSKMAKNCGDCFDLPEKYSCGWCPETKSCSVRTDCPNWADRTQYCPDPEIIQFSPETGPLEGGTKLTIEGESLGKVFEDIEQGVHVLLEAGNGSSVNVPCVPYRELYVRSTRIVCKVQRPRNNTFTMSGHIVVNVRDYFTTRSKQKYSFVNPSIESISPDKGPKSGGTNIEIHGVFLDAGSATEISVGGVPCHITKRQDFLLACKTTEAPTSRQGRLVVKFDDVRRELATYVYTFVEDPEINQVESGTEGTVARGIPSGGVTVHVKGEHLDVVQEPVMYVAVNGDKYYGKCMPETSQHLKCWSPAVPKEKLTFGEDPAVPLELEYGVRLDEVDSGLGLVAKRGFQPFQMFRNPVYFPFSEHGHVKEFKSDYLTIQGEHLNLASQEDDVVVRVGTQYCNVTSLSRTQLTCRPPSEQPAGRDADGNTDLEALPDVVIEVGNQLSFVIGKLKYTNSTTTAVTGMYFETTSDPSTNVTESMTE